MLSVRRIWTHETGLPKLDTSAARKQLGGKWKNRNMNKSQILVMSARMNEENKIRVVIGGCVVNCLVDTGASVTVMGRDLFQKIHGHYVKSKSTLNYAVTADGSRLNVSDCGEAIIRINDRGFATKFHVMPQVPHQLILGMDFFKRHGVILDLSEGKIIFKDPQIVNAHTHTKIPAMSEVFILGSIKRPVANGCEGEFVPSEQIANLGLLATHCVSTVVDGKIHVMIMNPNRDDVIIRKSTRIGKLLPVTNANLISATPGLDSLTPNPNSNTSIPVQIESDRLSESELHALQTVISEYADIFANNKADVGKTAIVTHGIEIEPGQRPRRSVPFRANPIERDIIKNEIDQCLESGVIRPSNSPWSSPVVLVKKPDGTFRICVDYRKLNSVTVSDVYPLPRIADALDTLGTAKPQYFSTLDLQSGYWQVEMSEESKQYTAFTTHCGLYEYNRLPFGLKNGPSTFQRLMESVLGSMNWRQCLVYLDDVIIFSRTFQEHLTDLQEVFQSLRDAGLKLKPSKCHFAKNEVKYLGHIVSAEGIAPCPEKCDAVRNFPTPHDVKSLRSFLGLANYYRKFVKGFSQIAAPLNRLLQKGVIFMWSEECDRAFCQLREMLCSAPILAYPDFDKPFILTTDASDSAIGGILGQMQDGKERVIHYTGRALNKHEKQYCVTEKEGLAIIHSLKVFDPYLRNSKFQIITDHQALKYIFHEKENTGSRVARWAMALQQYDYTVVHRAGRVNENADGLSRRHYDTEGEENFTPPVWNNMLAITRSKTKATHSRDEKTNAEPNTENPNTTDPSPDQREEADNPKTDDEIIFGNCPISNLRKLQSSDPFCQPFIDYLSEGKLPENQKAARRLVIEADNYGFIDGILYHFWFSDGAQKRKDRCFQQVVVPSSLRSEILGALHDEMTAGHQGFTRTLLNIKSRFYWPAMTADIENWVKSCRTCASRNRPGKETKAPLVTREVEGPFDTIVIDLVGPIKRSRNGNTYILTVEDYLSKWPEAIPIPDSKAHTIATALLDHIISRHSAPRVILSDRGQNFLSEIVKELCNLFDTKKVHSSAYRPQTQGLVERWHSTLYHMLSKFVNTDQSNWDEYIPMCLFAYRTTPATESTELSPFQILYGREPKLPIEQMLTPPRNLSNSVQEHIERILAKVREYQILAKENAARHSAKMKARYDQSCNDVDYKPGDSVWLYVPRTPQGLNKKFVHMWHGPYRIIQKPDELHAFLRNCDNNKLLPTAVHINRLKRAYDRALRPVKAIDENPDDDYIPLTEDELPADSFAEEQTPEEDKTYWQIEKLIKGRYRRGNLEYLAKWKNCTAKDNSWVPYENLNSAARQYLQENNVPITGKKDSD